MNLQKKLRFYYWFFIEYVRKHLRIIFLSILLSFIVILSLVSIAPYLTSFFFVKKRVIGLVGSYDYNQVPDEILSKISNGLLAVNSQGDFIPVLASSWEQIDGGKEYRFHLRNNLLWSDGTSFSAKDVNYSFKDVETRVIDDQTLYFYLKKPLAIFPTFLTRPIVRYPLKGVAGLYKVEKTKMKSGYIRELFLTPNKKGLPIIVYKIYENESNLVNAYKLGQVNEIVVDKKSVADSFSRWNNTVVKREVDYNRVVTLFFNLNNPLLKNREVRNAIVMALPTDWLKDLGDQAFGPVPPVSWAFNPNLKKTIYDLDTAKSLMDKFVEATQPATLSLSTYYEFFNFADLIKDSLKNININVNIRFMGPEKIGDFDMLLAYWRVPSDPDQYFFWHSVQKEGNITNYLSLKVDKLLEDGRSTLSIPERKKIYKKFQKILVDDQPAHFFYYPYLYKIKRK